MSNLLDQIFPHMYVCSAEQLAEFFNQCVLRDLRLQRYHTSLATIKHARDYVKAAKRTNNLATISSSQFILGFTYLHSGKFRNAERTLLSGIQAAQRSGHKAIELRCRVYVAELGEPAAGRGRGCYRSSQGSSGNSQGRGDVRVCRTLPAQTWRGVTGGEVD